MEFYHNLEFWSVIILVFVFFLAGFVDSIAGGGGLITLPSLLLAGIPAPLALGTNKFIVIFGTATALINFIKHKKVIYKVTIICVGFSLIGAYIGSRIILLFNPEKIISIILVLLPIAALIVFIPKRYTQNFQNEFSPLQTYIYAPLISFFIGGYDGFFGAGTGTLLILGFYWILNMNMVNASASAKAINLASGVGSFIVFAFSSHVLYLFALPLLIANILGGYTGSKFAIKKGVGAIKIFIIFSFIIMFISLSIKYFSN